MYRCNECGRTFEDPFYDEVCLEDYYGVGGMFPNSTYGVIAKCPYCNMDDIEEFDEDDVPEETIYYERQGDEYVYYNEDGCELYREPA